MLNGAETSGLDPHLQALAQQLAQQMLATLIQGNVPQTATLQDLEEVIAKLTINRPPINVMNYDTLVEINAAWES